MKMQALITILLMCVWGMVSGDNRNLRHDHNHYNLRWGHENFFLIDYLKDGEMERRISFGGITAKETSMGDGSKSLRLWQISDGMAFMQMIYADNELVDCENVRQKGLVHDFLSKFYHEVDRARARNFTSVPFEITAGQQSNEIDLSDNTILDDDPSDDASLPTSSVDAFGMRDLTYKVINMENDVPEDLRPVFNYKHLRQQCDMQHREMKQLIHAVNSDDDAMRLNATHSLQRKKRSIADWLIAPNTKWCGKGHSAGKYNVLGGASKSDKCCRRHDHCKHNIHAMTAKWNLFNYRPFTISRCRCDSRFRTCLKMANSADANMVGNLFFNIVQTKCFILKPEKYCKKRSWWGVCEQKGLRKRAHLRPNRRF